MLKSAMKKTASLYRNPKIWNGPYFETWTRPEPETTSQNL